MWGSKKSIEIKVRYRDLPPSITHTSIAVLSSFPFSRCSPPKTATLCPASPAPALKAATLHRMKAQSYHFFGGLLGLTSLTQTNSFIVPNHSAKIANNIISSSVSLSMARRGLETLEEGATPLREYTYHITRSRISNL
jgi:hypothetical protein